MKKRKTKTNDIVFDDNMTYEEFLEKRKQYTEAKYHEIAEENEPSNLYYKSDYTYKGVTYVGTSDYSHS